VEVGDVEEEAQGAYLKTDTKSPREVEEEVAIEAEGGAEEMVGIIAGSDHLRGT
jgi:hypothetical protein